MVSVIFIPLCLIIYCCISQCTAAFQFFIRLRNILNMNTYSLNFWSWGEIFPIENSAHTISFRISSKEEKKMFHVHAMKFTNRTNMLWTFVYCRRALKWIENQICCVIFSKHFVSILNHYEGTKIPSRPQFTFSVRILCIKSREN